MKPLPPVRRVITGTNAAGRSFFERDGSTPAQFTVPERPGYRISNLWRTGLPGLRSSAAATPDDIKEHNGVMPPIGGTILRVIDFPPRAEDLEVRRRQPPSTFVAIYPDACHQPENDRDEGMHITNTVDYAIVLHGEITAIMEEGETVLRAGDVLVQRGTSHAWLNHTSEIARVAFVLVDAPLVT